MSRTEPNNFRTKYFSIPGFALNQLLAYYQNWRRARRSIEFIDFGRETGPEGDAGRRKLKSDKR